MKATFAFLDHRHTMESVLVGNDQELLQYGAISIRRRRCEIHFLNQ
jgi:hypothetical protein